MLVWMAVVGCGAPSVPDDVGHVLLRRLNRAEYDNTVRDLLGTAQTPARDFPADPRVAGFDNVAAQLSTSPLHVEMFERAAGVLAREAVGGLRQRGRVRRIQAEGPLAAPVGGEVDGDHWQLPPGAQVTTPVEVATEGTYQLSFRVVGADPARVAVLAGEERREFVDYEGVEDGSHDVLRAEVELVTGRHDVGVVVVDGAPLALDWIELAGPIRYDPSQSPLVDCNPEDGGAEACAAQVLGELAPRAYRRPVTDAEQAHLEGLVATVMEQGGRFDEALEVTLMAVLLSPQFLYRVERLASPEGGEQPLDDHEVASRLSYFLWSSMPDEALFAAAAAGELSTEVGIAMQVRRMLRDPKAQALVDNFGGPWLYARGVGDAFKDPVLFPQFDEILRASLREEMDRLISSFVLDDRDLRELVTTSEGEIDAVLASHYGVPGVPAAGWHPADLGAVGRGGVLGQAGLLAVASYPARTSPVVRGQFVLGQLLCDEPPPPPPGVEGLDEDVTATTLRAQLEQHRADPECASCHEVMDELGFALEGFDAVGQARTEDRGLPIDDVGRLPDGATVQGVAELGQAVASDPRYPRCIAEKLFTYALGRVPGPGDEARLDHMTAAFVADGYRFRALATAIATDPAFRSTRRQP